MLKNRDGVIFYYPREEPRRSIGDKYIEDRPVW